VSTPQGPICNAWVTAEQVATCGADLPGVGSDVSVLDDAAYDASWLLYELSGRKFPGVCTATVRPCRDSCGCWGPDTSPVNGAWWWGYDSITGWWSWWDTGYQRSCGCGPDSMVLLAGAPVQEIVEVKIDGAVVDPSTYDLIRSRELVRLDDPGPPVVHRMWPGCQNVTLPDTEPGTFSVTYTWGGDPPPMGQMAAAELARQLWLACGAGECQLPSGVTRVVRQGVSYDVVLAFAKAMRSGATGLPLTDAFIAATNPDGRRRRNAVWSPDRQRYPRPVA